MPSLRGCIPTRPRWLRHDQRMRVPKRPAATIANVVSPHWRWSYSALYAISRGFCTTCPRCSSSQFNRSDFGSQPFTGIYEPGQPTSGPLGGASVVPRITPKMLKQHLDQFVVGQGRAKKVLSTAVYNHYQRIQELQRREEEMQEVMAQHARREMHAGVRHPVEGTTATGSMAEMISVRDDSELTLESDEFPGQESTTTASPLGQGPAPYQQPQSQPRLLHDYTPLTIEKSNVLLLGPSGVGKTLMAKTLARVLEVPFSMSDCTPLTQAGYIGEDVDIIIQRLLAASNYDVARAEQGIVCLDEIDKIATAKVSHGKDVSGEGVQQALLKIIEGTTVQVQAKNERSGPSRQPSSMPPPGWQPNSTSSSHSPGSSPPAQGAKTEIFNVRTDNILFVCTGAFVGLHKTIMDRVSRGSIGFGAHVRVSHSEDQNPSDTSVRGRGNEEILRRHLPFFTPQAPNTDNEEPEFNILDLVEPGDLQKYGMIPELVGRIPISCALASLNEEALVRVLTEPRNALLRQYEQLFSLSGVELHFTSAALRIIAKQASGMGTGARGLRTVLERLLGDAMFEAPGSLTKHILINEAVALRKQAAVYFGRGQQGAFHGMIADEEEDWERREAKRDAPKKQDDDIADFREYRQKAIAAGSF